MSPSDPGARREVEEIGVERLPIRLDQFLKWANVVATGGEAKHLIVDGQVSVGGDVERRRGRQLNEGSVVSVSNGGAYRVVSAS